jgi:hypothetical protein
MQLRSARPEAWPWGPFHFYGYALTVAVSLRQAAILAYWLP